MRLRYTLLAAGLMFGVTACKDDPLTSNDNLLGEVKIPLASRLIADMSEQEYQKMQAEVRETFDFDASTTIDCKRTGTALKTCNAFVDRKDEYGGTTVRVYFPDDHRYRHLSFKDGRYVSADVAQSEMGNDYTETAQFKNDTHDIQLGAQRYLVPQVFLVGG